MASRLDSAQSDEIGCAVQMQILVLRMVTWQNCYRADQSPCPGQKSMRHQSWRAVCLR